ncbi:Right handed beta helix region [Candidatus Gugararchaeum adminiculabundum]|nr:Right handed beta helix region [Candidatus Gugararchaeum adminiculabundum]
MLLTASLDAGGGALDVTGCDSIVSPGVYTLTENVSSAGTCFNISADNVLIDCNGHNITGNGDYYNGGIAGINRANITIMNCIIVGYGGGLQFSGLTNGTFINNTLMNNSIGANMWATQHSSFFNNTFVGNGEAIQLRGSNNWPVTPDENVLFNNTMYDNGYGIDFACIYSNFTNNSVYNNSGTGINLDGWANNVSGNLVVNNSENDIYVGDPSSGNSCESMAVENNTGFNGYPIGYFKTAQILSNEVYSELILCGADNSVLENITIEGSDVLNNNGFGVYYTDNSRFTNITSSGNNFGISIVQSNNNLLENSNFSNNYAPYAYNAGHGIYVSSSTGNNITGNAADNNSAFDFYFYATSVDDCDSKIENNIGSGGSPVGYFNSTQTIGNEVYSDLILCNADDSVLENITVGDPNIPNNNGFATFFTDNSRFTNLTTFYSISLYSSLNNLLENSITPGILIAPSDFSGYPSTNDTILNNTICSNGTGYGINLRSSNNTITNNEVCNQSTGIRVSGMDNLVASNIVHNNTEEGIGVSGDYYNDHRNNTIDNNTVYGNAKGILLEYFAGYNTVVNNTVYGSDWGGINVEGQSNYNNITNNTAYLNEFGFWVYYDTYSEANNKPEHNIFDGNFAHNNSQGGFFLDLAISTTLKNNIVYFEDRGYYLVNSPGISFLNNSAFNNSYGGLYVQNCTGFSSSGTTACGNTANGFKDILDVDGSNSYSGTTCQIATGANCDILCVPTHCYFLCSTQPSCGEVIDSNKRLNDDMVCTGTAITIGAGGVTLDCDSHSITYATGGAANNYGVNNTANYNGLTVKNCTLIDGAAVSSNHHAIISGGDSCVFRNNIISTSTGSAFALTEAGSADGNSVENNIITLIGDGGYYGIQLAGSSNNIINNLITISGGEGSDASGIGIFSFGGSAPANNWIQNNTINANLTGSGAAITLDGVDSNHVIQNTINNSWRYGIYMVNSEDTFIDNNTISNSTYSSIYLDGNSYITITLNSLYNSSAVALMVRNSPHTVISNNTLFNQTAGAIYLYNSSYLTIEGNTLNNTGSSEIMSIYRSSLSPVSTPLYAASLTPLAVGTRNCTNGFGFDGEGNPYAIPDAISFFNNMGSGGGGAPSCTFALQSCSSDDECCSTHCDGGVCSPDCVHEGEACLGNDNCCGYTGSGDICQADECTSTDSACFSMGDNCGAGTDCCSGNCAGGVCAACVLNGESCGGGGEPACETCCTGWGFGACGPDTFMGCTANDGACGGNGECCSANCSSDVCVASGGWNDVYTGDEGGSITLPSVQSIIYGGEILGIADPNANYDAACLDLSGIGASDNTTIYFRSTFGFNSCDDISNPDSLGAPCYGFAKSVLVGHGIGNNFTFNDTGLTGDLHIPIGYENPGYLNISPTESRECTNGYSSSNAVSFLLPEGAGGPGSPVDIIYNGEIYSHINTSADYGVACVNFGGVDGLDNATMYFESTTFGWNTCNDLETALAAPGICYGLAPGVLTTNGPGNNYTFHADAFNLISLVPDYSSPYLNYSVENVTTYGVQLEFPSCNNDWSNNGFYNTLVQDSGSSNETEVFYDASFSPVIAGTRVCNGVDQYGSTGVFFLTNLSGIQTMSIITADGQPVANVSTARNFDVACADMNGSGMNTTLYLDSSFGFDNCTGFPVTCYGFANDVLIANGAGNDFTYN